MLGRSKTCALVRLLVWLPTARRFLVAAEGCSHPVFPSKEAFPRFQEWKSSLSLKRKLRGNGDDEEEKASN
jgi:hypothetical protein